MRSFVILGALLSIQHAEKAESRNGAARRMQSARLFGDVSNFAYFYVDLLIGSPQPQRTSVIVDTGSTFVGFPCADVCDHCGHHLDPPFDISRSNSAELVPCSSMCNAGCSGSRCSYKEHFLEGSFIAGFWFQDYVRLGDTNQIHSYAENPLFSPGNASKSVKTQLGCNSNERSLFVTQRANGIMGLAPFQSRRPRILSALLRGLAHEMGDNSFSLCLAAVGGQLNIGGHNTSYHTGPIQWIPMTLGRYYTVRLDEIIVGNEIAATGHNFFGDAVLDSGTTLTTFPSAVFDAFDLAVKDYCGANYGCSATSIGDKCWKLQQLRPAKFPIVQMRFGSLTVTWNPQAYLVQSGSSNIWCRGYSKGGATTILGATWMLGKEVIFDIDNCLLGVAPANCPSHQDDHHQALVSDVKFEDGVVNETLITKGCTSRGFVIFMALLSIAAVCMRFSLVSHRMVGREEEEEEADDRVMTERVSLLNVESHFADE